MMKNVCGAVVGDIWRLGEGGYCYLLLEYKRPLWGGDEDTFQAICLDTGKYDAVFFSHYSRMGWEKAA
jgi:hypothetical protein